MKVVLALQWLASPLNFEFWFEKLLKSFLDNTLARQANHQSGKEKKGSVLGRFLGRKKVNTWVERFEGKAFSTGLKPVSRRLTVSCPDFQDCNPKKRFIVPATRQTIYLWLQILSSKYFFLCKDFTKGIHCCKKYSGQNTRRKKWQYIFLNLMKYSTPWTCLYPTL